MISQGGPPEDVGGGGGGSGRPHGVPRYFSA